MHCCIIGRLLVFFLLLLSISLNAPLSAQGGVTPVLNNGQKWQIGYCEGGPFSDYTSIMRTLIEGLIELGWIREDKPPDIFDETPNAYWEWLCGCHSPYLCFRSGNAYSAAWNDETRKENRKELLTRLKKGELDLVIAMGTWAGQDLANNEHSVPTMVLSCSDPIRAGIINCAENSGFGHVTARVDPDRYIRQIRMFHRIVGFKTMGLAFENTSDGRLYSNVNEVYQVAGERGFKVVTCEVIDTIPDTQKSDSSCLDCYRRLAETTDAVYVTALTCVDRKAHEIAEIFRKAGVASFSLTGSRLVENGIMLSISNGSGSALGNFHASKFAEILNGAKPGDLPQLLEDQPEIAVNMRTVREIGFKMPQSILRIATEIFDR